MGQGGCPGLGYGRVLGAPKYMRAAIKNSWGLKEMPHVCRTSNFLSLENKSKRADHTPLT